MRPPAPESLSVRRAFAYGAILILIPYAATSGERNRTQREALLHRIQQLTIERVMFAPIMDFRAWWTGTALLNTRLTRFLTCFPSWEDVP